MEQFTRKVRIEGQQIGGTPVVPGGAAHDVPIPRSDDAGGIQGGKQILERLAATVIHLRGHERQTPQFNISRSGGG